MKRKLIDSAQMSYRQKLKKLMLLQMSDPNFSPVAKIEWNEGNIARKPVQIYGSKVLSEKPVALLKNTSEGEISGGSFPIFWPIIIT